MHSPCSDCVYVGSLSVAINLRALPSESLLCLGLEGLNSVDVESSCDITVLAMETKTEVNQNKL